VREAKREAVSRGGRELPPVAVLTRPSSERPRTASASRPTLSLFAVERFTVGGALVAALVVARAFRDIPTLWGLVYVAAFLLFHRLAVASYGRRVVRIDALTSLRDLLFASAAAAMSLLALGSIVSRDRALAPQIVHLWWLSAAFVFPASLLLVQFELRGRRTGRRCRQALIVGAGHVGQLVARRLIERPELGLDPVGFLDKDPVELEPQTPGLPVLGGSRDLEKVIRDHTVDHVIFTFSTAPHDVLLRMISRCQDLGISVSIVPRLFEKVTTRSKLDHLGGLPLLSLHSVDVEGWQLRLKYALDRILAALLVVLTLPLLLGSALAVWCSSGWPILYRQTRVGRDGKEFEMLKFRTMRPASEEASAFDLLPGMAPGGVEGVDRRTRVGVFLRRTSLDELPQLINVLRGEMSLVGPRPERPEFSEMFSQTVYRYGDRLRVKSGITGWAQVHGLRGQTSLSERIEWDNYYIENWSLLLDLRIIAMTVQAAWALRAD
jgi:exopolysaccharide biosynthesis polyprenyl glycosylphosphotransferase